MDFKFLTRTALLAIATGALTLPALAQWQWIDNNGRKVFSDQSPPAEIPLKNILKQPGIRASGSNQASAPAPVTATSAPAPKASLPRLSGKDAELEARKKQADAHEESRRQAEAQQLAKARADNCERAKKGQGTLKSGVRLATTNAKGEREFMDDAARAAEAKRLEAIVQSDCAP